MPKTKKENKKKKPDMYVPKNNGIFCTECGSQLDDFSFSNKSKNKKQVIKNHQKCIKTGKFSGEFCSKIFIASDSLLDEIWLKDE